MIASLAGADPGTAVRLGVSMVALQASIGALNDLIDSPVDAGRKPAKPIPAGIVSPAEAKFVVAAGAVIGLVGALPSGPALGVLALAILLVGYGYDLRAKGTPWSWVPFAIGIPLLPVFGWFGAVGVLPSTFLILLPAAVAAGAALAIGNARADLERDLSAGVRSVATRLGARRAWLVEASLFGLVVALALGSLLVAGSTAPSIAGSTCAAVVIGAGLAWGRDGTPKRRQRGWEIEAIGVALLAAAWLAGYGGLR